MVCSSINKYPDNQKLHANLLESHTFPLCPVHVFLYPFVRFGNVSGPSSQSNIPVLHVKATDRDGARQATGMRS